MNRKILLLTLCLALPYFLKAYTVSIKGIVYNNNDKGIPGVEVLVKSLPTDPFQYQNTLTTNDEGIFHVEVEVPDDIQKGTLIFSLAACTSAANSKRIVYGPNHLEHTLKLQDCRDHQRDCAVHIGIRRTDNNEIILKAEVKGVEPIKFEWSTGETTQEIKASNKIKYCVTITASDGCQARDCKDLTQDAECKTSIQVSRKNSDAAFYLLQARTKGEAPFSYYWSTDETGEKIEVSEPGEYCVRVVDALGCESHDCVVIGGQDCITKIQVSRTTPNSDAVAVKLIARSKGRAPFTYLWNTGEVSEMIAVSEPGEYCVQVIDATGCTSRDCVVLDPRKDCKTEIAISHNQSDLSTGLLLTARTHGRPPFSYKWSNGDTTKSINVSDLREYCVEVTDANGCISKDCVDLSVLADSCSVKIHRTGSGSLVAQPRGFPPFTFEWSTGSTGRVTQIDGPGEYCVVVTNTLGCIARACIVIDDVPSDKCRVKIHRRPVNDAGLVELVAEVKGQGDFQFEWSNGETSQSILVDAAGEYCVIAFTSNCKARDCVKVRLDQGPSVASSGIDFSQTTFVVKPMISFAVSPNPTTDALNLQWTSEVGPGTVHITISSIKGGIVWQRKTDSVKGMNDLVIDASHLTAGLYVVSVKGSEFSKQIKFIKN